MRFAAHDPRIRAIATKSTYAAMYYLMNEGFTTVQAIVRVF